jgi:hypothetical protein
MSGVLISHNLIPKDVDGIIMSEEGSSRATAYVESNKILSNKETKFVTYLENGYDNKFRVMLAEIKKNRIQKNVCVGYSLTNHGGASIKFDKTGRIYIVYGGHTSGLKIRYSKKPFDISDLSKEIKITKKGTGLTYPSFEIDDYNNMHLICRKMDLNEDLSPSKPSLNYFKIDISNGLKILSDKELISFPEYKYGNFTSSIAIKDNIISIIYRIYLKDNKEELKKTSYGYIKSVDFGKNFLNYRNKRVQLPIDFNSNSNLEISEKFLCYISNISYTSSGEIKFILTELNKKSENSYLISIDNKMYKKERLNNIYDLVHERKINVYVAISIDRDDNIFLAFSTLPNTKDESWDSPNNRISYFKISKNNVDLIYNNIKSTEGMSWLPNIEQNRNHFSNRYKDIPMLIFSEGETTNDLYRKVNSKVISIDF